MHSSVFTFKIGGEAGFGIMSAGLAFSKIAARSGYFIFDYVEYPSLIRGGHNVMQTSVSEYPVTSQYKSTDFLIALNQETIDFHSDELNNGAYLLYDGEQSMKVDNVMEGVTVISIPFDQIARTAGGSILMRNTASLGATVFLLGGNLQILKDIIAEEFGKGKEAIIQKNWNVAQAGYDYALENYSNKVRDVLRPKDQIEDNIIVTANDAVALGAIAGGLQFASIYPMTPTSNILSILAPQQEKYGFIYKQPEDEISAINMAIGASYAGVRSMVATSGGGFCLMTEGYGLAGMTEVPIVIIEGMRGSPATGLPSWTEQGDLRFVLHAHQGDFPRIILAAGDVEEAFYLTMEAFNLADKYQTPVIVLIDKYICESHMSIKPFKYDNYVVDRGKFTKEKVLDYARYALSEDGISVRTIPGVDNFYITNSDEHTDEGYSTEVAHIRREQMQKRMKKIETCEKKDMQEPIVFGPKDADTTIVSWGSNKGPILEAMKDMPSVNYVHIQWMNPFPADSLRKLLENAKHIVNIECNYTAQMGGLIREKTGIQITDNLLKYDGRPFHPEEIREKILKQLDEHITTLPIQQFV
ncbi:MAG TPA: 2-oxoacid:acceptor oxidoreductase subunit alpha [Candidatus Nitrosocosmicus sp.]|nr:2-oxoacid:acceptor oxidoreductase subunit alpha [Candidatus Nitrosocosmicus sp.]